MEIPSYPRLQPYKIRQYLDTEKGGLKNVSRLAKEDISDQTHKSSVTHRTIEIRQSRKTKPPSLLLVSSIT